MRPYSRVSHQGRPVLPSPALQGGRGGDGGGGRAEGGVSTDSDACRPLPGALPGKHAGKRLAM